MKLKKRIRLGDLLVEHKFISEAQLVEALSEQKKTGRKLGRVLVENGYVSENDLLNLLSTQLKLPYIDVSNYPINAEVAKVIPETVARRYRVIALQNTPDGILMGMTDPTNIFAYDELVRLLKREVRLAVVKESDLLSAFEKVYQHGDQLKNLATELGEEISDNVFDLVSLNQSATHSDAPVVKLLESVFENAVRVKASDIHIEPDDDVLRIRRRVDGVLQEQVMDEKRIAAAVVSRLKLMAGLDISEKRLPQDGRFNLKLKDNSIDVRLSTMPTSTGESVVMRLQDQSSGLMRLDKLGMSESMLTRLRKAIHKPHGLMLVTGPTGSGKTTTLYAALHELNKPERKIITVEDPVEFQLPRINQVQVNNKIDLNFARVLRATLRQDPDVILLGEIRDKETAEIALRASITGHLVLSTLHTNDAVSTALRLIEMGMESFLVASAVHVILAQRLVRRICDNCMVPYEPNQGQKIWLENMLSGKEEPIALKYGKGCQKCNYTGYLGRIAVHELLEVDEAQADAMRCKDYVDFKNKAIASEGYEPLVISALHLAKRGDTTLDEVIRINGWIE
ncbi:MAG: type II/IV secretion system protein [Gammaproteobacteria bacterium]|nr:type II/IV secretion system protein [Gammaproteobacteria bacterium]